jgi:hypothetical protein
MLQNQNQEMGRENAKEFQRIVKMRRMNRKLLILGFKEII